MIELLVDRLRWPAALVRERAASQLGKLIADGNQDAPDALIAWIAHQELESLAAIGLLPFLYAAASEDARSLAADELVSACKARSVLSELYLSHLDPSHVSCPRLCRHSGWPPVEWQVPDQVSNPPTRPPGAIFRERLQEIERCYMRSLTRQFDFEVSVLSEIHGESPMRALRATGSGEVHHPGWRPLASEVWLSAFLRTLAWAASSESLPKDLAVQEAARASPIDLGLWGVRPTASPEWWPTIVTNGDRGEIDQEMVAILQNVEAAADAWGTGSHFVLAASGCISQTSLAQHDLEVRSFFQRPIGPDRPDSEGLFEYLRSVPASVSQESSPLRFEGVVTIDTTPRRLADWLVVPCSGSTHPDAIIVWQPWRGVRGIQCPSHELAASDIQAVCREDAIDYESGEGLIARWSDWAQGLSAVTVRNLLPASGWVLVAPRAVVDRFSEATGMKLAWAWEITSHFREYSYGDFVEHQSA